MKRYRSDRSNAGGSNIRRWRVAGVAGVAVAMVGVGLGVAAASDTAVPTVNCPTVADKLGAVPAQAQAEIDRNLALLQTQIDEANARLKSSAGEGGKNFVQNAILGPLEDKRFATINRMETAIGRNADKPDLNAEGLSTCSLDAEADAGADGGDAEAEPTAAPTTEAPAGNAGNNGNAGNDQAAASRDTGNVGINDGTAQVDCPDVVIDVAIPAQAANEVNQNLELLQKQIDEANARIKSTAFQGGVNFINNSILGPLEDKRFATINRIETAIGRNADKPNLNAEGLSACNLNK
jgi:hypothetical protein